MVMLRLVLGRSEELLYAAFANTLCPVWELSQCCVPFCEPFLKCRAVKRENLSFCELSSFFEGKAVSFDCLLNKH